MSSPLPSSSHPLPPHTHPPPPASSSALLPHTAGAPALDALASSGAIAPSALAPSALVLTPELTAAILELGQAVAGIRAFLASHYGWPGYGTTVVSITGAQQIPVTGEKLQQIEQPMDIAMTSAGKMLTRQVSAAVRLQAATRGLLARRRVREMRDLQLIQPCTPS